MIRRFLTFLAFLVRFCIAFAVGIALGLICDHFKIKPLAFCFGIAALLGVGLALTSPGRIRLPERLAYFGIKLCFLVALGAFRLAKRLAIWGDIYTFLRIEVRTYEHDGPEPEPEREPEPKPEPSPYIFRGRIFDPAPYGYKPEVAEYLGETA